MIHQYLNFTVFTTCTSVVLFFITLLYVFWDVHYFIRVALTILWGRLFQKRSKVDDTTTIYGVCTTNDLDIIFKHMNNARYVRELDFARFHYYDRTGIYGIITKAKAHALQTACNIRYRRTIPLFSVYKVTTKCIYWDEKSVYLEQQFVTVNDGFIRAINVSKQHIIGLDVYETMAKLLGKDSSYRPDMPEELKLWIESMEASSARLRKKD